MAGWMLPLFLFLVWSVWHVAIVTGVRRREHQQNTPPERRRFVSAMPGVILLPLFSWYVAHMINRAEPSWGTRIVCTLHLLFLIYLLSTIAYDIWYFSMNGRSHHN